MSENVAASAGLGETGQIRSRNLLVGQEGVTRSAPAL
jgi:hypothetical protein